MNASRHLPLTSSLHSSELAACSRPLRANSISKWVHTQYEFLNEGFPLPLPWIAFSILHHAEQPLRSEFAHLRPYTNRTSWFYVSCIAYQAWKLQICLKSNYCQLFIIDKNTFFWATIKPTSFLGHNEYSLVPGWQWNQPPMYHSSFTQLCC